MEIHIWIESTPRSDHKILSMLKNKFGENNAEYAGGIGTSGHRVIIVNHNNSSDVVDLLKGNKYVISINTL